MTTHQGPSEPTCLPLDLAWPEIEAALRSHRNLVLVAEPGAGKTTRFPPLLFRSNLVPEGQKILMLEPRRLAARASAQRIADEQSWKLGLSEVGYQVRFDNRMTEQTRLQVITEGLLAKRLQSDPELKDVGCVILDEFHERSQHTDLALGILYEMQQLARPDLRIVVMSATLDAEAVSRFLSHGPGFAPIIKVPGRTFPVEIRHRKRPLALDVGPEALDQIANLLRDLMDGTQDRIGDVLVFLPGAREIRQVCERLAPTTDRFGCVCIELHGSLSINEQDLALNPDPRGRTKIICSTNIAETSLTIHGVGTVVDSGLARVTRTDSAGFERLQLSRISLASATQRTGRAGRLAPGLCYRLWSKLDEASMPDFEQPELLRMDLTDPILTLLAQGITDPEHFSWFEAPSPAAMRSALTQLTDLGYRERLGGKLTSAGKMALRLPLTARLAKLMLEAAHWNQITLGARLCALLSEKDLIRRTHDLKRRAGQESDLLARLHLLEGERAGLDQNAVRNILRVSDAIESAVDRLRLSGKEPTRTSETDRDELALKLILLAYPDRVCRRRRAKEPAARMVGGRGVRLAPFSLVETAELFVALLTSEPPPNFSRDARTSSSGDAQVSLASYIERSWLEEYWPKALQRQTLIVFDDLTLSVQKQWALAFHDLPLEEAHPSRPTPDEAFQALLSAAMERWTTHFMSHTELGHCLARLEFLVSLDPEVADVLHESKFANVQLQFLQEVCFGETRLQDVLGKDLSAAFVRALPSEIARKLDEFAPETWIAPTGNRIRIQYPAGRAPFLEIRVQELFGLAESPKLAGKRVAVVMHLLGPNYRPVQVTSDLASFWRTGYLEVRKELRARYPKHSWPDDPITARPEAKGRRRTPS